MTHIRIREKLKIILEMQMKAEAIHINKVNILRKRKGRYGHVERFRENVPNTEKA